MVVLIFISLIISDAKHLFMGLLTIKRGIKIHMMKYYFLFYLYYF